jgi:hypothetical protein
MERERRTTIEHYNIQVKSTNEYSNEPGGDSNDWRTPRFAERNMRHPARRPQGLKPLALRGVGGTAEAVP